jgi:hypothetical protein
MAINVPSFTTPQGEIKTNVYAKVAQSHYYNQGPSDPSLHCEVHFFASKTASDTGFMPYRIENFIISPWAPGGATGTITVVGQPSYIDGDSFEINDGYNPSVTYIFDSANNVSDTATQRRVSFNPDGDSSLAAAADLLATAINNTPQATFFVRAKSNGSAGTVSLINCYSKVDVADAGFTVSGMSGGSDLIDLSAEVEEELLQLPTFAGGTRV